MGHDCKHLDLAAIKHQTYSQITEQILLHHPIPLFVPQLHRWSQSLNVCGCPLGHWALPADTGHGAMRFWPVFLAAALASQWDAEFYRSPLRRLGLHGRITRAWGIPSGND